MRARRGIQIQPTPDDASTQPVTASCRVAGTITFDAKPKRGATASGTVPVTITCDRVEPIPEPLSLRGSSSVVLGTQRGPPPLAPGWRQGVSHTYGNQDPHDASFQAQPDHSRSVLALEARAAEAETHLPCRARRCSASRTLTSSPSAAFPSGSTDGDVV